MRNCKDGILIFSWMCRYDIVAVFSVRSSLYQSVTLVLHVYIVYNIFIVNGINEQRNTRDNRKTASNI